MTLSLLISILVAHPQVASAVSAQARPTARLIYLRGAEAESCPDEPALRKAVSARLRYDPFRTDGATALRVVVSRADRTWRARITLLDGQDQTVGERELLAHRDCAELASALELAISIAIDPQMLSRPLVSAPAVEAPPQQVTTLHLEVGAVLDLGLLPRPSGGLLVGGRLQRGRLSLGAEAAADLPASFSVSGGRIDAFLLRAQLAACVSFEPVALCGLGSAGALRIDGLGLDDAKGAWAPFLAGGVRSTLEIPAQGTYSLRIHLDLLVPVLRTLALVSDAEAWRAPPLAGTVGVSMIRHFW